MSWHQTLRVAIRALLRNKMRSFLTTLGVIIGVSAVISMVAIGDGAKAQVEQSFVSMGSNLLIIRSGTTTAGGARGGVGSSQSLTWEDLKAIQTEVPSVRFAAAQMRTTTQVMSEDQNWTTSVIGTSPEYFDIRSWPVATGSLFGASDLASGNKVAVLGRTVADKLFVPGVDPVGQTVRLRNSPFLVIGSLVPKGQSPVGQDYDDAVFIPQSAFAAVIQGGLKKHVSGTIFVSATSEEATERALSRITSLLRERHRIREGMDDDFSIQDLTEVAEAQQAGTNTLTTLLACIAAVSLLVGGIGIMNIMLVSVTERTREIGVRLAIGAKRRNILAQFLVEALTLSVTGGVIGVALGLAGAERLASHFGWPVLVRPWVIAIAVGFSALVGVGFGLYPARRASRLDPIEALRFE